MIPGDLERLFPICTPGASDSATFDEVLELLHLGGRSPAARGADDDPRGVGEPRRDGPGPPRVLRVPLDLHGAVGRPGLRHLHRRHRHRRRARPQRPASRSLLGDRRRPGRAGLARPACSTSTRHAWSARAGCSPAACSWSTPSTAGWSATTRSSPRWPPSTPTRSGCTPARSAWRTCPSASTSSTPPPRSPGASRRSATPRRSCGSCSRRWPARGGEALGSMGTDSPIAVLSTRPRLIFDYFTQLFAQVTNPPLDSIREELVTSLGTTIGPEGNALDGDARRTPASCCCRSRCIDNDELAKIVHINADGDLPGYATYVVRGLYDVHGGAAAHGRRGWRRSSPRCPRRSPTGARFVVLSDRDSGRDLAPIPSLLLTSAVHHHLIREKTRTQVGLLVEAGDVREVHHVALLIGYGAAAVNPYLAMESVEDLVRSGELTGVDRREGRRQPDQGARQGRAEGDVQDGHLHRRVLPRRPGVRGDRARRRSWSTATSPAPSPSSAASAWTSSPPRSRPGTRRPTPPTGVRLPHRKLDVGGEYQWRREGEPHLFDPETVFRLQHSTRQRRYDIFKQYTASGRRAVRAADDAARPVRLQDQRRATPVPLEEVEPVSAIVKRFYTGAMSYGSISQEAHETLAIAMNRLGGSSNTGEGGEDEDRLLDPGAPLRDQAGRLRPVRRDQPLPHPGRRHPDQDGPGRQARRGRPAARPQGLPVGGPDPALDARRRPDLAAAAPRHLLHRGPRPADPRPQERQPAARIHVKLVSEVGVGTVAAGRQQGARRRRADLRPRRRHRRLAADLAQARRRAVGARPRRDPADAGAQRPARPDRRPGRRPAQDRPGRRRRGAARRRGVRLRDRAAGGQRLHHDARLPPRHLPGRASPPRTPSCARGSPASPSSSRRSSSTSPRRSASTWPRWGSARSRRPSARVEPLDTTAAVEHWKASGLDLTPILTEAEPSDGAARAPHRRTRTTGWRRRSTTCSSR